MPCLMGSGTQTTTVGEEHTLLDIAAQGTYWYEIDLSAMQAGDTVELRVYLTLLAGAQPKTAIYEMYEGVQGGDDNDFVKKSDRLSVDNFSPGSAYRATVKQITGSSRAFPWKILCRQDAPVTA